MGQFVEGRERKQERTRESLSHVTSILNITSLPLSFFSFFTDERESAIPNGKSCWATASARGIASARELQG